MTTEINFCLDCWTGYIGEHRCTNPPPEEWVMLPYYHDRRSYLARKDGWAEEHLTWEGDHPELMDGDDN